MADPDNLSGRVAARYVEAAKTSDARLDKFLATWSKAEVKRLGKILNSFGNLNLEDMHHALAYMQEQAGYVTDEGADVPAYLKSTRKQNAAQWERVPKKQAQDMWDNLKQIKQFIKDYERAVKP